MYHSGSFKSRRLKSSSIKAILLGTGSLFVLSSEAIAQISVDEVIVTARRIEENQQEVPITVNSYSAEELSARGLTNITQIGDFTPGLTIDFTSPISGSSASASTFIRGVGQSDFLLTIDPGVGIYVDGVYIARSVGGVVDLLNTERVEVLKGPQGTLFGRNTIGGAINITSRRPGDEFFAEGEVSVGNFNRRDVRVAADVPLLEDVQLSLAFSSKNKDGYGERIPFDGPQQGDITLTGPTPGAFALAGSPFLSQAAGNSTELGNENTDTARAALYWQPTDRLDLKFAYDYTRTREASPVSTLLSTSAAPVFTDVDGNRVSPDTPGAFANPGAVGPQPFGPDSLQTLGNTIIAAVAPDTVTPFDDRFITGDPFTTFATGPNFSNLDINGFSFSGKYELTDNIEGELILAYRDLEAVFGRDGDNSPLVVDHTSNIYNHEQFTAELKFSGISLEDRLKWTAGGFYFEEQGDDNVFVPLGHVGGLPGAAPLLQLDELNQTDNTSFAAFGEGSFSLTDSLSVTAGLRFTDETRRYDPIHQDFGQFFATAAGGAFDLFGPTASGNSTLLLPLGEVEQSFSDLSYRAGLEYRATDDIFLYANVSTGFKAGGFTGRTVQPVPEPVPFDEENLIQYEVGFKSDFWDGRARFNAAGFFSEYDDIQIVVQEGITPITVNAASAEISGIEADLRLQVTENFFLNANGAYTNAEYTEVDLSSTNALSSSVTVDSEFANIPEFKSSVTAEYSTTVPTGDLRLRGDWTYTSEIFNNAENTPELVEPDLHLFNAGLTYANESGDWDLIFTVRNITDEEYIVSGFDQPGVGFTEATFARPREWGLTFKYRLQ